MVLWIVLAVALLGLVVLAVAARAPLARLPRLRRAVRRLEHNGAQAQALQAKAVALQDRLAGMQRDAQRRPHPADHGVVVPPKSRG